jgi:WD40 repeat protein/transcriptional regulator with XRE-family HTH domain
VIDLQLSQVDTPEFFAAALTRLREHRGLSIRELSKLSGVPVATLGGYFSGRHLPSPTQPAVLASILHALGESDHDGWRDALQRVRRTPGPKRRTESPYRGLEPFDVDDAAWFHGREEVVGQLTAEVTAVLGGAPGPRVLGLVGSSGSGKSSILRAGVAAALRSVGVDVAVMIPGAHPAAALAVAKRSVRGEAKVLVVDQLEELFSAEPAERADFLVEMGAFAESGVVLASLRADFYAHAIGEPALLGMLGEGQRLIGPMSTDELRSAICTPAAQVGGSVSDDLLDLLLREVRARNGAAYDAGSLPLLAHALLATWRASRDGRLDVADYRATGGIDGAIRQSAEEVYESLDDAGRQAARQLFAQLVHVDDDGLVTRRRLDHADLSLTDVDAFERVVAAFVARRILTAGEETLDISHEALLEAWPRLQEWIAEVADDLRVRRRVSKAASTWAEFGREESQLMGGTALSLAEGLAARSAAGGVVLSGSELAFVQASRAHADLIERARQRGRRRLERFAVAVAVFALLACGLAAYALHAKGEASLARDEALSRQIAIQSATVATFDPALGMQLALAAYDASPTLEARSALLDTTARPATSRTLGPAGGMRAVTSPDGHTVAVVASDGKVRFFTLHGKKAPTLRAETSASDADLFAAAWRPDGRALAVGGVNGVLRLVDTADLDRPTVGKPIAGVTTAVQSVAWTGDGTELLAATSDPSLLRWSVARDAGGSVLTPVPGSKEFDGSANSVAVGGGRARGLIAVASSDGKVRLLRRTPGALVPVSELSLGAATNFAFAVAFSPDGRWLAATAKDQKARVWEITDPAHPAAPVELTGFSTWVNAVAFSHDGSRIAVGGSGGLAQIWRTSDWTLEQRMESGSNFTAVDFVTDDSALVTSSIDGTLRVVSLHGPRISGLGGSIWAAGYTKDGEHYLAGTGSPSPSVRVVDTARAGGPLADPRALTGPAEVGVVDGVAAVSPDGRTVVAGTATGELVVWRRTGDGSATSDWVRTGTVPAAGALVEGAAFSPDGERLAAAADDGAVSIYRVGASGLPHLLWKLEAGGIATTPAFSPDGDLLAVGTADKAVLVWSLHGGKPRKLRPLTGFDNYVYGVAFRPDGHLLAASGADKKVRLFSVDGTKLRAVGRPLAGPQDTIWSVAFSGDGRTLMGASQDGALWAWRTSGDTASVWVRLRGGEAELYSVAMDPRGGHVTAAGEDGTVATWTLSLRDAERRVCAVTGDGVTAQEWRQYVPGAAYAPPCRRRS